MANRSINRDRSVTTDRLDAFFADGENYAKTVDPNSVVDANMLAANQLAENGYGAKSGVISYSSKDNGYGVYGLGQFKLSTAQTLAKQAGLGDLSGQALIDATNDPAKSTRMMTQNLINTENYLKNSLNGQNGKPNWDSLSDNEKKAIVIGGYNPGDPKNLSIIKQSTDSNGVFHLDQYYNNYNNALAPVDQQGRSVERVKAMGGAVSSVGDVPINQVTSQLSPDQASKESLITQGDAATSVPDQSFLQSNYTTVEANLPSLALTEDLDNTPWYLDNDSIVGNPNLLDRQIVPAYFEINLKQSNSDRLKDSNNTPIMVRLNVSLQEIDISEAHIMSNSQTLTGYHISVWGQEPDIISATGTTGLFINRYGIAPLMSKRGADIQEYTKYINLNPNSFDINANIKNPFKIAAQDAFMEMLGLFKNNGITRYHPELTSRIFQTGNPGNSQVVGEASWSPAIGASSTQAQNRNNDILTRGYVVFNYKSAVFLGYFKTLNFSINANNPYKWDFNFTFQVEKRLTVAYTPL